MSEPSNHPRGATGMAESDRGPTGDAGLDADVQSPQRTVEPGATNALPRGKPADSVAWSLRLTAEWCVRLLVVGLTLYVVVKVYQTVHLVAFSFVIGLLIAAVLRPLNGVLLRWHFPHALAALTSVLVAVVVLSGIGYFVADQISSNVDELGTQLTRSVDQVRDWLVTGPFHLKQSDLQSLADRVTASIKANSTSIAGGAVSTALSVAEGLSGVLLVVLTSFFLVKDGEKIWAWLLAMLPRNARPKVQEAGERSWQTLGGYVRGQVTIALFHGISITVALFVFGVPLAAPLGVLVFLGSFIPIIGLIVAGSLCVLISLLEHGIITGVIIATIVVVLVQLESHVLQPLIMSRAVSIHPLAVALSVIAGTKLDGIPGALLAVPLVAVGNTAFKALHGVSTADQPAVHLPRPRLRRPKRRAADRPAG